MKTHTHTHTQRIILVALVAHHTPTLMPYSSTTTINMGSLLFWGIRYKPSSD